ncbi:hypothetical protein L520_0831 [Bordetella bronchiseptica MBORD681]|uniref:hypothetical protein n=1 Tax=Bordetella bronchiseptica TaxID=518 RepID=UPI000461293E|nr:hypothetical protein [Bordetella bronchiseptica]KDD02985.1 hypothetical protein L521_1035 [Bordetella bronchiseptica MBORD698]KDD03821.1 hypothetical protein L520_0831 [Bordetella bronchiseptica MBORD681]
MAGSFEFNRVTFGLPVETFRVDAYIALDERLPAVTEFVMRLLKVCERVPLTAVRDYFGFNDIEARAVIESLAKQGLLEVSEDQVVLSSFALEKFDEAGGDHPRFSKVELKSDTVTFDLVSFTPLRSTLVEMASDNIIKLDAAEDALGNSVERARLAYRRRYPEIASLRADLRERSYGVYSVESVESRRRNYVQVPVSFELDQDGHVERRMDEVFERIVPPELLHFVSEQVTAAIPRTLSLPAAGFDAFIEAFDLRLLNQYLTGKRFDLLRYLAEVQVGRSVRYAEGAEPMFGNLYLQGNRERILERLNDRRLGKRRHGALLTSLAWLVPDYALWGRGDAFAQSVNALSSALHSGGHGDDLYLFANADSDEESDVTNSLRVPHLQELHFVRQQPAGGRIMSGRVEILLYPTAFMVAMFHLPAPGNEGLWVPIGFISSQDGHLDTAHKLLRQAASGARYGRRARFNHKAQLAPPSEFDDACAFLNYCTLRSGSQRPSD